MREAVRRFLSHDCGPFAQFVKYGAIGVAATAVQFAVFYALASTCLRCLTADDTAVRLLGLPGAEFTGAEPWYASRWFLAGVATAVGFVFANVFCWLMNRAFVFRPGKFRWYMGVMTSAAVVIEVVVSFLLNFFARKFFIFRG